MSFKSHIKRILCYYFKLKYLNQKVFHLTLKKYNFFLKNIEYIYTNRFQISHLKKKTGSRPGRLRHGLTCWVDQVWSGHYTNWFFNKFRPIQLRDRPAKLVWI